MFRLSEPTDDAVVKRTWLVSVAAFERDEMKHTIHCVVCPHYTHVSTSTRQYPIRETMVPETCIGNLHQFRALVFLVVSCAKLNAELFSIRNQHACNQNCVI